MKETLNSETYFRRRFFSRPIIVSLQSCKIGKNMNFFKNKKAAKKQTSFQKVVNIIIKNNVVFHILLLREQKFYPILLQ